MNLIFEPTKAGDFYAIIQPYREKSVGEMSKDTFADTWRVRLYGIFSFDVKDMEEARKKVASFFIV